MFESHIKKIDKLLGFALDASHKSPEAYADNVQHIACYSQALAALHTAAHVCTPTGTEPPVAFTIDDVSKVQEITGVSMLGARNGAPDTLLGAEWLRQHPADKTLIYASAAPAQVREMTAVGEALGCEVRFAGHHTSKSVRLPVAVYRLAPGVLAYVRDNLHDVNVAVCSTRPLDIPLSSLYPAHSLDWYEERKRRAEAYVPGEYDFSTLDWYEDYSGAILLPEGDQLFRAEHPFLQGIRDLLDFSEGTTYRKGVRVWAVAVPDLRPQDAGPDGLNALSVLQAVQSAAVENT